MSFQYITKAGNIAFPAKFLWAGSFWKGTACVHSESFGWGFIDTEGTLKVRLPDFQSEPTEFFDGLALIRRDKLYGFMDWSGTICIKPQYRRAEPFGDGVAPVRTSNTFTFIDTKGRIVMNQSFSSLNRFAGHFAHGDRPTDADWERLEAEIGYRFPLTHKRFTEAVGPIVKETKIPLYPQANGFLRIGSASNRMDLLLSSDSPSGSPYRLIWLDQDYYAD